MDIEVIVATHKPYKMPTDPMYVPLQVGAFGKKDIGFLRDNTGENISSLNPYFCELTGLFWAWKNLNADYIGLTHYRRHFKGNHSGSTKFDKVLSKQEAEALLEKTDVILPKKRHYYIETIYSHYAHTHYERELIATRQILVEHYPGYVPSWDKVMKRRSAHMFNMCIMKKEKLDSYCSFIFDVLDRLNQKVNVSEYDDFQARLFGRISELLLDVWIDHNHIEYIEVPVIHMEPVNWWKKGTSFIKAKFFGKKYEGSF